MNQKPGRPGEILAACPAFSYILFSADDFNLQIVRTGKAKQP